LTETEIQIVLADDHQVVRSGLRLLLQAEDDMRVIGEAGDVAAAERLVEARRPHVLVLDLNMPGPSSLDAIPGFAATTAVVVLTMQDDPAFARQALQAGARGYVLKESADAELVSAIRAAAEGRTYLNPELGARLVSAPEAPDDLSEREVEVLRLIALGYTNTEIAGQLYLSVRTVESHRAAIHRKLNLETRAELVQHAIERGLLKTT
jgi:two-component system, NarL family, response regulator NreC